LPNLDQNLALATRAVPPAFWQALAVGAWSAGRRCPKADQRADAHHHVWRLSRGDYGWLKPTPKLLPIHRDFMLRELRPQLRGANVGATVLVQAAPTPGETHFLLEIANASGGLVRGVVGWADLAADDAVAALGSLAAEPLLKGVRPMLQDLPDPSWIALPEVQPALAALPTLGLRFDALVTPRELKPLLATLDRHPDLAAVIDPCAKPDIANGAWQPWADDLAAIARQSSARCKLSGLVTEAGRGWSVDALRRYVAHARLFWQRARDLGSDWPVLTLAASYAEWVEAATSVRRLDAREATRSTAAMRGASRSGLENVALQAGAMEDRRRDPSIDRGRIECRHLFPLHQDFGLVNLVAAIFQRRIFARRPRALGICCSRRVDRQAEQLVAVRQDRPGQLFVDEIVGCQRKIRREYAELQREIERGRRLAAARDADQNQLCLGQIARRRAVVVRLREVDRLHAREILEAVGDAMCAPGRMRRLGAELGLQRRDKDLKQVEHQRVGAPELCAHRIVDDRAEYQRAAAFCRGVLVDPV
jgi:L-fuconolactonase